MLKNRQKPMHSSRRNGGVLPLTKSAASVAALLASGLWLTTAPAYANNSAADTGINRTALRGTFPDLRVDANRDGIVDLSGKSDERLEDSQLALFLPNLDDDAKRCGPGEDLYSDALFGNDYDPKVDRRLLTCNDAQDDIVNGSRDEQDLARIHALPLPDVVDRATVVVSGAPAGAVRLFIRQGGQLRAFNPATEKVPVQALRNGLELLLEGRDIIRDNSWDGSVRVSLYLPSGAGDSVRLRVAPLLLQHTLQHSQRVLLSPYKLLSREQFEELYKDIPEYLYEDYVSDLQFFNMGYGEFRDTLNAARRSARVKPGLKELNTNTDRWTQDIFEPAYASVPGADGKPQVMRILIRSAQLWRVGGRAVFSLRGPDVGVVQQFSTDLPATVDQSLNSLGNLDAVPAHTAHGVHYPNGRILLGSGE
ncbi:protein-arginine deiminase family protein, partial [Methylocucumis oryzae]|uniref:protein-arginine deiminase family protein n=1 Tax=Methylocucumis oryzae TaxID=1632867 RepID=UPI0019552F0D